MAAPFFCLKNSPWNVKYALERHISSRTDNWAISNGHLSGKHIQFTSEQEKDGRIPFLDTCVSINQDGSTKISVYRKPTHTDQYLNFQSNHHLQHTRAVVYTLMLRAQTLVTENDDRTRETQHVKQALKMNNYPEWMLTIPHPKSTTEDTEEPQNEKKIYASTPYI